MDSINQKILLDLPDGIELFIKREDKEITLKGTVQIPMDEVDGYQATDDAKKTIREAWLKG